MDKWISIEEKLPSDNEVVLCALRTGKVMTGKGVYHDERKTEIWTQGGYRKFTHWMPCPEPPGGWKHEQLTK